MAINFSNTARAMYLRGSLNNSDSVSTVQVSSSVSGIQEDGAFYGWPAPPFYAVIDDGNASQEVVRVDVKVGAGANTEYTITRGTALGADSYQSVTKAHNGWAIIKPVWSAADATNALALGSILTGGSTINNSTASNVPITLRGAVGQSADLFAIKSSTDSTLFSIGSTGNVLLQKASPTLTIDSTSGDAHIFIRASAGSDRTLRYYTGSSPRWVLKSTNEAESGSNSGSNFQFARYSDAGTYIDSPLIINRSTGLVSLASLSVSGAATFTSAVTVGTPTTASHATTKTYVDTALALKFNASGGVLSGSLTGTTGTFSGQLSASSLVLSGAITGATTGAFSGAVSVGTPSGASDATTKTYVDTGLASKLNLTGGTLDGDLTVRDAIYLQGIGGSTTGGGAEIRAGGSQYTFVINPRGSGAGYQTNSEFYYDSSADMWVSETKFHSSNNMSTNGTFSAAGTITATSGMLSPDSTVTARSFIQSRNGVPTAEDLAMPNVFVAGAMPSSYTNKTWFYNTANMLFEYTLNGTDWLTQSNTTTEMKKLVAGGDQNSSIVIPNGAVKYRITFTTSPGYCYVSSLYGYTSTNGNTMAVKIQKKPFGGSWADHTTSTTQISNWPGFIFLPFDGLAWNTGTYTDQIRVEFTPTWINGNNISLSHLSLWGSYPSGKSTVYTTDGDQNVTFPTKLYHQGGSYIPKVTVSATAPSSPSDGDLWVDSSTPSWTAPTFQNSWTNYGSEWNTAGYYKDANGVVHLRGLVKSGSIGAIFTLPSGYRPTATWLFICASNSSATPPGYARVDVNNSGVVSLNTYSANSNNGWVSLDGITFATF